MNNKWTYGNAISRYPIKEGEIWGTDIMQVAIHDLRNDNLPSFMYDADCIFVDPPWNQGNVNSFITKADRNDYITSYDDFFMALMKNIRYVMPDVIYLEMGKEYLAQWYIELSKLYKRITFYNSTYYHKKDCLCYVIRATNRNMKNDIKPQLDNMDEEDIIKWICENERFTTIGDFCMGRGLVGKYATMYNRKVVGTELNPKRLACLLENVNARLLASTH